MNTLQWTIRITFQGVVFFFFFPYYFSSPKLETAIDFLLLKIN